jgi:putative flippase GtrA
MTPTTGPLRHLSPETRRRTLTFVAIGTVCTLAYLGLYAALRATMAAPTANVVAQLVTTVMSTAANRRFTMRLSGSQQAMRHHVEMVGVFVLGLVVNDMALDLLAQAAPDAGSVVEMLVLLLSGGLATAVKVFLMARWKRTPSVPGGTMDGDDTVRPPAAGRLVAVARTTVDPARRPGPVPGRRGGAPASGAGRPAGRGGRRRRPDAGPAGRRDGLVRGPGVRGALRDAAAARRPEMS